MQHRRHTHGGGGHRIARVLVSMPKELVPGIKRHETLKPPPTRCPGAIAVRPENHRLNSSFVFLHACQIVPSDMIKLMPLQLETRFGEKVTLN